MMCGRSVRACLYIYVQIVYTSYMCVVWCAFYGRAVHRLWTCVRKMRLVTAPRGKLRCALYRSVIVVFAFASLWYARRCGASVSRTVWYIRADRGLYKYSVKRLVRCSVAFMTIHNDDDDNGCVVRWRDGPLVHHVYILSGMCIANRPHFDGTRGSGSDRMYMQRSFICSDRDRLTNRGKKNTLSRRLPACVRACERVLVLMNVLTDCWRTGTFSLRARG